MHASLSAQSRQRGAAVLAFAVFLVFVVSLLVISSSRSLVFAQKASGNQYWAVQAHEAAQAGLEETLAWLNSVPPPASQPTNCSTLTPWVSSCWGADATTSSGTDQCLSSSSGTCSNRTVTTANGFTATVTFHRDSVPLSKLNFVEIVSQAVANSDSSITATVRQVVYLSPFTGNAAAAPNAPILMQGCITQVTGTPDICPENASGGSPCTASSGTAGVAIATLSTQSASSCLQTGNSVWDALFPNLSKGQLQALSQLQANAGLTRTSTPKRTVYYYTPGTFVNDDHGSPSEPVIVIVECGGNCPKLNGGTDIYGMLYFDEGDSMQGWGNTTIHGVFGVEGDIEKFTANTEFHYNGALDFAMSPAAPGAGVVPRIPGSWQDY
ncbi:MAG TPA: PilX N-terminal domain-containing pilus assembly protein [Pseudomonas sp.]